MARENKHLASRMKSVLNSGKYQSGEYLPPIRDLCAQLGVSFETARKGLKRLEEEGLLTSEARKGYRVKVSNPTPNAPIAYITNYQKDMSNAQPVNWAITQHLMVVSSERGRATIGIHVQGQSETEIRNGLGSNAIAGVVLDSLDSRLLRTVQRTLLCPLVMVNSWFENIDVNVVLQDNYLGGYLASQWFHEIGLKRVGWVGPLAPYCHTRERFAGVVAGTLSHGISLAPEHIIDSREGAMESRLRDLLSRPSRPQGLAVFTKSEVQTLKSVCDEMGLKVGKDLFVVGWSVEDCVDSEYYSIFRGAEPPPAIVWSARDMANAALDIICTPNVPGMQGRRTLVRTRLKRTPRD